MTGVEFVNAEGDTQFIERSSPCFPGVVISLGGIGVITRVSLQLVPEFDATQVVYGTFPNRDQENVEWTTNTLIDAFYDLFSSADSLSVLIDWYCIRSLLYMLAYSPDVLSYSIPE